MSLSISPLTFSDEKECATHHARKLFEEVSPYQFLRELTQNGIEAIEELRRKTGIVEESKISWDVDWKFLEKTGYYKLCCIDDGVGMTGPELVRLKKLTATRRELSSSGNFGVGAKISALPSNPLGIIYRSWVNGVGAMAKLRYDPSSKLYGLEKWVWEDGRVEEWIPIDDSWKPTDNDCFNSQGIDLNGTIVTLLGSYEEQDTMQKNKENQEESKKQRGDGRWFNTLQNRRRFRIPANILIRTREQLYKLNDPKHNVFRRVFGQEYWLDDIDFKGIPHIKLKGIVQLENAKAYWYVTDPNSAIYAGHFNGRGHTAAIFQDELYEITETKIASEARLRQFGCTYDQKHVIIYIVPEPPKGMIIAPNLSRSKLFYVSTNNPSLPSQQLPWIEWAEEFRNDIPQELSDYQDTVGASVASADYREQILENINKMRQFYNYGDQTSGRGPGSIIVLEKLSKKVSGDPDDPKKEIIGEITSIKRKPGRPPGSKNKTKAERKSAREKPTLKEGNPQKKGKLGLILLTPDKIAEIERPVRRKVQLIPPKVMWTSNDDSVCDESSPSPSAAKFDTYGNLLIIYADFPGYRKMYKEWISKYPEISNHVSRTVRMVYEQQLVECVLGGQSYSISIEMTREDAMKTYLSEYALTAAVFPCQKVYEAISASFIKEFGRPKEDNIVHFQNAA